jgi:hypothetical protein
MDKQTNAPAPTVTGPRVLLGAFILWQLAFLFGVNFLEMIKWARDEMPKDKEAARGIERVFPGWPSKSGHFHDLADLGDKVTRRYAQLTGQTQGWSLFAPDVGKQCVFPAVLVRWDDDPFSAPALTRPLTPLAAGGPLEAAALWAAALERPLPVPVPKLAARELSVLAATSPLEVGLLRAALPPAPVPAAPVTILSDNEPRDIGSYFRVGNFRLRRLESNLTLVLRQVDDETPAEAAERWRGRIAELLEDNGDVVRAYLRWRWDSYRKANPEAPPPKQLIFLVRRYPITAPKHAPPYWQGPFTVPVARWQPDVHWSAGRSPLEMYNPVTQRFQEVKR